jgi:hypothetical protein
MAHFALVDENNIVLRVDPVANEDCLKNGVEDEATGVAHQRNVYQDQNQNWIQVSYNTKNGVHYEPNSWTPSEDQSKALRFNYPGPDWIYRPTEDIFHEPQPYNSWTLNTTTWLYEAPVAYPSITSDGTDADGNKRYYDIIWNEELLRWEATSPDDVEVYWDPNTSAWVNI